MARTLITTIENKKRKNLVINGDMRVDQRWAGAAISAANMLNGYTVDRWIFYGTQANKVNGGQNQGGHPFVPGGSAYFNLNSISSYSSISTDYFSFVQAIEGYNSAFLAWGTSSAKTVTLSFWVRCTVTGVFSGALKNAGQTRSYPFTYTINSPSVWEYKTITIPGDTAGTWVTDNGVGVYIQFDVGSGSNFLGTAGSWANGNLIGATGAVKLVATNGANLNLTEIQLEEGTVATPFERISITEQLNQCYRYFFNNFQGTIGYVASGTLGYFFRPLPVTMRAAPSITQIPGTSLVNTVDESGFASRTVTAIATLTGFTNTTTHAGIRLDAAYGGTGRLLALQAQIIQASAEY